MKQFLLAGIAVLFVSANASENPFDLKENFGKIDSDQEVLLSELRKLAELKELAEEKEGVPEIVEVLEVIDEPMPPVVPEEIHLDVTPEIKEAEVKISEPVEVADVSISATLEEVAEVDTEKFEMIRKNVMDAQKKKFEAKQQVSENVAKEAEEQALVVNIKEEDEVAKVKAQREAEKLEVEAYEKERAAKLAKKVEEDAVSEKEKLVQEAAREKRLARKASMQEQEAADEAKAQQMAAANEETESDLGLDFDIESEEAAAKAAADLAYEEAVREMEEED